ncbi:MAG TPA: hypothetical protein VFY48_02920 [Solirubrobacterales bacterium]|nr:hypothetical protein [Solirubrobacterales bacterium]
MKARSAPEALMALALTAIASLLLAATAAAEPLLDLELTRTAQPTHVGDERLAYKATVSNEASAGAGVPTELTCKGTPEDGVTWSATPPPTFAYAWLRNGEPIPGATERTYTTVSADAGKSVQCVVTGTNDPDEVLAGGNLYAPVASSTASLPPTLIDPPPASAPPTGSSGPGQAGPLMASTPSGTATLTEGSKILADVVTSEGSGTFSNGSTVVTGVTATAGVFEGFQAVGGTCVAPETTIFKVEETAPDVLQVTLSKPASCSGSGILEAGAQPFSLGQEISGECIPAGAEIIRATNQGSPGEPTVPFIEMDEAATCSKAGVAITATSTLTCNAPSGWTAGSAITWSFQWLRNGAPIPGANTVQYTVQSADTEPPSVLQCQATAEDAQGQKAVAVSTPRSTRPTPPSPYGFPGGLTPAVDFENQTSGEVALSLEAPAGPDINIFTVKGAGWSCVKTPAESSLPPTASCSRDDTLAPQDSYPPLNLVVALGKQPPTTLVTKAEASGGNALSPATAEDEYTIPEDPLPFGFEFFEIEVLDELGNDYTQAGGHPFSAGASIAFNTHMRAEADGVFAEAVNGSPKAVRTETPAGFTGNPLAAGEICAASAGSLGACPDESAVGTIYVSTPVSPSEFTPTPIYAMQPERGQPAQFAFQVAEFAFTLNPELRPEDNYAIDLVTQPLPRSPEVLLSEVALCSFGVIMNGPEPEGCREADDPEATEKPFLTNPTDCTAPAPTTRITADSWEEPGKFATAEDVSPPLTGCEEVDFEPSISFKPTSSQADSPTGMQVELTMPTEGLEEKEGVAGANLKGTTVLLPEGMAVNPSSAAGQEACSLDQIGIAQSGVPNDQPVSCPDASKLGTVEATTPILDEPLNGTVYLAQQGSNPFNSLLALYLVIDSPDKGILIKLAGKVSPDPNTGRLTVSFDENPQAPIANVKLNFAGGNRAALINPPSCGTYDIQTRMTPWGDQPPVEVTSSFQVTQGPNGGACPSGALEPKLRAWPADFNTAGKTTPFVLDLSREDGTQRFRSISTTMPPGLTAYLKGVPYCPDSVLSSIPTAPGTAAAQIASPACPSASQVGTVTTGAGAGPDPLFLDTGRAYLAGPYKGAPLSLAIAAPAVTGPFDLGNVVVRTALNVNPATAQITAVSDPIPTILEGIPLDIRQVRVNVNRPNFTLAPTNCEPLSTTATVTGEKGATATVSDRFQVGGCDKLGFKPSLKLKLKGSPKRGAYQQLTATLNARPGDANIARASVALPHSIFLAQEHIRTVCTRVQFAADACPKGSVYGQATAISPLVDYPLQGTVYLRSSSNPLPDMVIAFKGPAHQPVEIELAGRVDSVNGGIRNSFDLVPDAPVSKFTLKLRGGKKSLLVNSRDLCKGKKQKATVKMAAQNGRTREFRPVVAASCKGKKPGKGKGR